MESCVGMGEKKGERGREEGEGLGLGFGSNSCSAGIPPQKLVRTEAFPFRMVAPAPAPRPSGPTLFYGGSCDAYEAARALQPLPSALRSPVLGVGVGGAAAVGLRRFPFTPAQWQELQRQAMIYKHFVASVPVPADLLVPISASSFPDAPPHLSPNLVGRGGGVCYNLRFGNSVDPEPGRCRRTDGKKWRCSRDVAPGQKYCERHVHRGRPRSRKPVELHKPKPATPITPAITTTTPSSATVAADNNPSARATTTSLSQPFAVDSTGFLPKSELKLPFLSMEANKDPRFSGWMKGGGEEMASRRQWDLMQSKIVSRSSTTPVLQQYDGQLNLNYTDLNDQCCPFLNPDLSSLEGDTIANHRDRPRSFIDAWSTETLAAATSGDKSTVTFAGKLPLSTLSLSMCGIEEDADQVEMGLGLSDPAAKSPQTSWMAPGPLGEVLQSSNVTSPPHGSSSSKGSCGGGCLINLMGKGCCGSQEVSPQESPTRVVSSPSGVVQKALVSLSDSSCSSSPTFAAAASCRPEFTLQWISQRK